jgi:uncharacterized phage-associated protein/plasmid maintenance system antidote protein VapI
MPKSISDSSSLAAFAKKHFGDSAGWQSRFADALGIPRQRVNGLISGREPLGSVAREKLRAFAKYNNIPVEPWMELEPSKIKTLISQSVVLPEVTDEFAKASAAFKGFNKRKFAAMAHYIIYRCRQNPEKLGSVKLNKICYFADRAATGQLGRRLAGESYLRWEMGAVPRHIKDVLNDLMSSGMIKVEPSKKEGQPDMYQSIVTPRLDAFDGDEMRIIEEAIDLILPMSAKEASDYSHDALWHHTKGGEDMQF